MTAACDVPCVNNRAASNRRASNAALRRCPCCGVVMPQHRMVPDDNHHFISRDSLVDPAAEIAEGGADHSVSCRKAPRHLGFEVDLDPVYALDVRRHTLGHGLDVAAKRLGDGVEVSTRLRGGVTHLLPETDKLLTETPQSLVKIGTGLSIHARSLADRPRKPQACPSGHIRAHRCAMASISTRAPAGSLAACTVERAGGTSPACRL